MIHVSWPVLCKVELQNARDILEHIYARISYRGHDDKVVVALRALIKDTKTTLELLDDTFDENNLHKAL